MGASESKFYKFTSRYYIISILLLPLKAGYWKNIRENKNELGAPSRRRHLVQAGVICLSIAAFWVGAAAKLARMLGPQPFPTTDHSSTEGFCPKLTTLAFKPGEWLSQVLARADQHFSPILTRHNSRNCFYH
jgi:hypothetical protein